MKSHWRALWFLVFIWCVMTGGAFPVFAGTAPARSTPPLVSAPSYVLMDVETGRVLASRNMNQKRFPASTTKTMTALLAVENGDLNSIVTVGPNPTKVGESSIYLQKGEQFTLRELVQAALIKSANDSCLAIAEYMAGSEAAFAEKMNRKARELGAKNTHFVNPHGLHDANHYSTAYDLALIAREAMKNPAFNEIIDIKKTTIKGNAKIGGRRILVNHNKLLFRWNECDGVKTGTTKQAGRCLIASATRIDPVSKRPWRLLSVVLHDTGDKWADSAYLLQREGFEKYTRTTMARGGEKLAEVIVKGGERPVEAVAEREIRLPLNANERSTLTSQVHSLDREAPVEKGQTVAWLSWNLNGRKIASVPLVAREEVGQSLVSKVLPAAALLFPSKPLLRWSVYALGLSGVLLLIVGWKVRTHEIKRRKRKQAERSGARRLVG